MKRSEKVVIGTIGAIAVAGLWPTTKPKEEPADAFVYASVEACRQGGQITISECNEAWASASDQNLGTAQKFTDIADCEKAHGGGECRLATWDGQSVFVPAMIGYMIARQSVAGGAFKTTAQPLYPASATTRACVPGADPQLRPDCAPAASRSGTGSSGSSGSSSSSSSRSQTRWFRTAAGHLIVDYLRPSTSRGTTTVPRSSTVAPSVRTSIVSRGGFGSTARSISRIGS
jgi:uncharacterized protein YgiB involved in biofilm formation